MTPHAHRCVVLCCRVPAAQQPLCPAPRSRSHRASRPRASEIGRLHNLIDLDIHGNNISMLPAEMGRLLHLEKLRLDFNPITSPPYDIVIKDVRTIVFYLRDRIDGAPCAVWRVMACVRCVMVGCVQCAVRCRSATG